MDDSLLVEDPLSLLLLLVMDAACAQNAQPRVLVFSKTAGYRHASIAAGADALMRLGQRHGFEVDTTEAAGRFTALELKRDGIAWYGGHIAKADDGHSCFVFHGDIPGRFGAV